MGWWGCGVMDGDLPLDAYLEIELLLGSKEAIAAIEVACDEQRRGECYARIEEEAAARLSSGDVASIMSRIEAYDISYRGITIMVLGEMMMQHDGHISDELKQKFIAAATEDKWAESSDGRKRAMDDYIERMRNHIAGTPAGEV